MCDWWYLLTPIVRYKYGILATKEHNYRVFRVNDTAYTSILAQKNTSWYMPTTARKACSRGSHRVFANKNTSDESHAGQYILSAV